MSNKKEKMPTGVYLRSTRVLNMKNSIIPRVNHYFEENNIRKCILYFLLLFYLKYFFFFLYFLINYDNNL